MDRQIIEGIEGCRPLSDDLNAPEFGAVARAVADDAEVRRAYQRVQAWDVAISAAMERVPLPVGLAERIVERLQAGASALPQDAIGRPPDNVVWTLRVSALRRPLPRRGGGGWLVRRCWPSPPAC